MNETTNTIIMAASLLINTFYFLTLLTKYVEKRRDRKRDESNLYARVSYLEELREKDFNRVTAINEDRQRHIDKINMEISRILEKRISHE